MRIAGTDLVDLAESARISVRADLDRDGQAELGQYLTPAPVAGFMASMFGPLPRRLKILDAGAGVGSLTAALVAEACSRETLPIELSATAFEVEAGFHGPLVTTMKRCGELVAGVGGTFTSRIQTDDFIEAAVGDLAGFSCGHVASKDKFNVAVLNPPYRKIRSDSRHRHLLRHVGIEVSNLYPAFVLLALRLMEPGGQLVAITPRSFCNGPYFRPFRRRLLELASFRRIHVFDGRREQFVDDAVLQENVVFHVVKSLAPPGIIHLSRSASPGGSVTGHDVETVDVISPRDPDKVIHLAVSEDCARLARAVQRLPCSLGDLSLQVSTGRVVEFRARPWLRDSMVDVDCVPLVHPCHLSAGRVLWREGASKRPSAIVQTNETAKLLLPASERFVLTKRFTSKEERRRVVAAVLEPGVFPGSAIGLENHLNYFHRKGRGVPAWLAAGLAVYLNSALVDAYFRQFSGHTQVNASDLRRLRFPSADQLERLGKIGCDSQAAIDKAMSEILSREQRGASTALP